MYKEGCSVSESHRLWFLLQYRRLKIEHPEYTYRKRFFIARIRTIKYYKLY